MDFDWNCLLGKFHPSQLTCKTCGRVYKTRYIQKKLFVIMTFNGFIGLHRISTL